MERLSHWKEVWKEELDQVENPFFAAPEVRQNLLSTRDLPGLLDLLKSCGFPTYRNSTGEEAERLLEHVKKGEWLLIKKHPFSPIDVNAYPLTNLCRSRNEFQCAAASPLPAPGPGKWQTTKVDIKKLASSLAFVANRVTSMGDEGRFFLS